jgi:Flp pilus assembly pilin Flp
MKLFSLLKKFRNDESGAVTVDWVVLTAGVVGLGLVAVNVIMPALGNQGRNINTAMGNAVTQGTTAANLGGSGN